MAPLLDTGDDGEATLFHGAAERREGVEAVVEARAGIACCRYERLPTGQPIVRVQVEEALAPLDVEVLKALDGMLCSLQLLVGCRLREA